MAEVAVDLITPIVHILIVDLAIRLCSRTASYLLDGALGEFLRIVLDGPDQSV